MLLDVNHSCVLLVDIQEKLLPAIHQSQQLLTNIGWLLQLANAQAVPIIVAEQYPQGLGHTVETLTPHLMTATKIEKTHFSCVAESSGALITEQSRQQIVLCGIEAHVCVLQTALQLIPHKEVYVVTDAIGSRDPYDKDLAIGRLQQNRVTLVTREMVYFEWLRCAATQRFREMNKRFMKKDG